jgi:hypothetical protein
VKVTIEVFAAVLRLRWARVIRVLAAPVAGIRTARVAVEGVVAADIAHRDTSAVEALCYCGLGHGYDTSMMRPGAGRPKVRM